MFWWCHFSVSSSRVLFRGFLKSSGEGTSVCLSWMSAFPSHCWWPLPSCSFFLLQLPLCPLSAIFFLQKSAELLPQLFWIVCSCSPFSVRASFISTWLEIAFPFWFYFICFSTCHHLTYSIVNLLVVLLSAFCYNKISMKAGDLFVLFTVLTKLPNSMMKRF